MIALLGLANHMHGEPNFSRAYYAQVVRKASAPDQGEVTRLVWLGVTCGLGACNNDSATPDEMQHFFWAYVALADNEDDIEPVRDESLTDLES